MRLARGWLAAVAAVAAAALATGAAHAQDAATDAITHRVRQGDTLELLAAELYGDRTKAVYIVAENKLLHARPLRPGERLRIPVSRDVVTAPGDTFESLAGVYLGNARRAPFLAEANAMSADDSLAAGTVIAIPLTIVHTATATESLADIAKLYLGDARQAELLRRYNFLDKRAIDKAESVIVPVYRVRLAANHQLPLDAESRARRDHRRDAAARVARALPAARQAWRDGDYAEVMAALGPVEPDLDYLDAGDAAELGVLLGATRIANHANDLALEIFKKVVDRQPHYLLRKYDYSSKIVAVWQSAGGQIE